MFLTLNGQFNNKINDAVEAPDKPKGMLKPRHTLSSNIELHFYDKRNTQVDKEPCSNNQLPLVTSK